MLKLSKAALLPLLLPLGWRESASLLVAIGIHFVEGQHGKGIIMMYSQQRWNETNDLRDNRMSTSMMSEESKEGRQPPTFD